MTTAPHGYNMPPLAWWVSPERTARVIPTLLDWCLDTPGEVYFQSGFSLKVDAADAKQLVLDSVGNGRLELLRMTEDRRSLRRLLLHTDGEVFLQTYDSSRDWQHHLAVLQPPLLHVAPDVANAFVRPLNASIRVRMEAWEESPPTPYATTRELPIRLWFLKHLEAEYLPDAYGQQVVTTSHLHRLGPLPETRWIVRDLGHDRHLITSTDPVAWFDFDKRPYRYADNDNSHTRPPMPDAATLTQAREDFTGAILTAEVVDENPPPPLTGTRLYG